MLLMDRHNMILAEPESNARPVLGSCWMADRPTAASSEFFPGRFVC